MQLGSASAQTLPDQVPTPKPRPAVSQPVPAPVSLTPPPASAGSLSVPEQPSPAAEDEISLSLPQTLSTLPRVRQQSVSGTAAAPAQSASPAAPASQVVRAEQPQTVTLPSVKKGSSSVDAIKGTLKQALDALDKNKPATALAIHKGMRSSLDRTLLSYILIIGGYHDLPASEIKAFYDHQQQWPSRSLIARRIEEAVVRETASGREMVNAFGNITPESTTAAIELAISHMKIGNKKMAAKLISPIWQSNALSSELETRILANLGPVLTNQDHFNRASYLLYRDRATGAARLKRYLSSGQNKVVEARTAVIRRTKDASAKLKAVPSSLQKDPGYIYSYIQYLRRVGKETQAADMLLRAPLDEDHLINRDAWWDERRLLARMMLNNGDARRAYKIAARHSAKPGKDFSEAEFHAGFFALRFLNDHKTAAIHFERSWKNATRDRDKSRGLYWQGRAWEAAGDRSVALKFYKAGGNPTNYYGQLALEETGVTHLNLRTPRPATSEEQTRFNSRSLVKAIKRLKAVGHEDRAGSIFRHLARILDNPSEIALAHKLAQSYGLHQNATQIGIIALDRNMPVDKLAFPLHALPSGVKTNGVDIALVYALTKQESVFNISARSHAGARGLMQMLPATAKTTARKLGVKYSTSKLTSDARYAVLLGSAFLKENLEKFGGSYILTFAAYNAGPGRPPQWIERFGDPRTRQVSAIDWVERIPFSETRDYVMKLIENLQVYEARIHNETLDISKDLKRGQP
ncbi:transglycosylase SLT domain-containing protein [uncultured Cohaesibacter sp.]|uniref:lytic transglycosylase domain-containing protein n=1 Tax=uncultured Cohaesibacter sp. TaxID=1002546 RepID=UPI00292E4503|nr:transglycosylase SLT domain-containing protein [uncultured Cohaesibacter sp.]